MPLFKCEGCGCVENTALSNFWTRGINWTTGEPVIPKPPALCSECDPAIGTWHGEFPKRPWDADAAANSGMPPELALPEPRS